MSTGYITVKVFTAEKAIPVQRAQVRIIDLRIALDQTMYTDQYGNAERIKVYAPEKETSLKPQDITLPYETYNIEVVKDGYIPTIINNVPVFPGEISLQPVAMMPQPRGQKFASLVNNFELSPNGLLLKGQKQPSSAPETYNPLQTKPVFIPEVIRVHLGEPGSDDKTVLVPFVDYVKNVASSEIYATWPTESLQANILAIISYALNRIYTGFYPSKGYNYDITADPDNDPYYVDGRNIYWNINDMVNEIFNKYIKRIGFNEPLLANYCNGITTRCEGLSQWGSVTLANQGKKADDILKYYYGNVQLEMTQDIQGVEKKYPGKLIRLGDVGQNVMVIQQQLNQISKTYNNIPDIPVENGNFDAYTQDAVRAFQKQFNLSPDGIVGKKTWYQLAFVYNAARRLLDLSKKSRNIKVPESAPSSTLKEGSTGADVRLLQYLLNAASVFYNSVFPVEENGTFDKATKDSVNSFQKTFSLSQTGTVDGATWNALLNVYQGIEDQAGAVFDLLGENRGQREKEQSGQSAQEGGQDQMQKRNQGTSIGTKRPGAAAEGRGETAGMRMGVQSGVQTPGSGAEPQGAGTQSNQSRIAETMNYAGGIYPLGNRGQINMAYSSDILDYIPDTYAGRDEQDTIMPGISPFESDIRETGEFGIGKYETYEKDDQTGISRGGKWKTQPDGQKREDGQSNILRDGTGRMQRGGQKMQKDGVTENKTGGMQPRAGTTPQEPVFNQMYTPNMPDGKPEDTSPGTGMPQSGKAEFQMYNPWIADDRMAGKEYDSGPSMTRRFHTWTNDDRTGDQMSKSGTNESEMKPFDYMPWTKQSGDRQPETGNRQPETGSRQPETQAFEYYYEPEDTMDMDRGTRGMQTGPTAPQPERGSQQGTTGPLNQRMQTRMPGGMPYQPLGQIYQMRSAPGNVPPESPHQGRMEPPRTGTSDQMECPPLPIVNPPYQNKVLKIGSRGKDVQLMQEYLSYIALSLMRYKKITNELKVVVNDGIYGIDTTDAVIRFQNRYEMPVNGIIDAPTWAKIVEVYNTPCD